MIRNKDEIDYTGPESAVRKLMDKEDVSWFPMERSLLTEGSYEEEETSYEHKIDRILEFQKTAQALFEEVSERLDTMSYQVSANSEQIFSIREHQTKNDKRHGQSREVSPTRPHAELGDEVHLFEHFLCKKRVSSAEQFK